MSLFNYDAYEKVFPSEPEQPMADSAVDTFKPTSSEKPTDKAGAEDLNADPTPVQPKEDKTIVQIEEPTQPAEEPKGD